MVIVSVVIPTFRRPQLLANCLSALDRQGLDISSYEVIVVSDGPDEDTRKTVAVFQERQKPFHFLEMPFRRGPAAARNAGWLQAAGILVAFTDDDTVPSEGWLSAICRAYRGEKLIAYTGRIHVPLSSNPTDYEMNTAGLEGAGFVTANCCCTREALELVRGFDERFSMAWREDSDLEFKLILHDVPIVHLDEALVVHPVRPAPWGISMKEQKKGMFNALLYKKYPGLYRQKIEPSPPWNYYLMILSLLVLVAAWRAGNIIISVAACTLWGGLLIHFIYGRLRHTSRSFHHVMEMVVTSMMIPFLSVYWQLYGAWRFRVLFL